MFSEPINFDKDFYIYGENDEVIFYENAYVLKVLNNSDDNTIEIAELVEKNDDYYVINTKTYKNWIKTKNELTTYYADSTMEKSQNINTITIEI